MAAALDLTLLAIFVLLLRTLLRIGKKSDRTTVFAVGHMLDSKRKRTDRLLLLSRVWLQSTRRCSDPFQQARDQGQRQPDNVEVTAADTRNPSRRISLDCVGTRLIHGLAAGDIRQKLPGRKCSHGDLGYFRSNFEAAPSRSPTTATPVTTWWVRPESSSSMRTASAASDRLAQHLPVAHHNRIGAQDQLRLASPANWRWAKTSSAFSRASLVANRMAPSSRPARLGHGGCLDLKTISRLG